MKVTKLSQKTHTEAETILKKSNLLRLLSPFGDVRIGGSYYTDLMYGPDIDITIATKTPRKSAVEFLNKIINKRSFQKYQYGDFEKFSRPKRPKDHIVVLILPFKNRKWEIEIWFTKKHYPSQVRLEEKLKNLPATTKKKIIEMKAKREKSGISKHKLSSFNIYKKFI